MRIRGFEARDLTLLSPPLLKPSDLDWYVAPQGRAWTAVEDDRVLMCGGVVGMPPNGRAWVLISDEMYLRPITMHRIVMQKLDEIYLTFPKVKVAVHSASPRAHRWVERLGFERSERIENYAGTSDSYDGYVRNVGR